LGKEALRQEDKCILPALRRYIDEAIEDAGDDDISSGKKRTLEITQMARGCAMVILKEVKEKGFTITNPRWLANASWVQRAIQVSHIGINRTSQRRAGAHQADIKKPQ
jgi:hypothetical protein